MADPAQDALARLEAELARRDKEDLRLLLFAMAGAVMVVGLFAGNIGQQLLVGLGLLASYLIGRGAERSAFQRRDKRPPLPAAPNEP